MAHNVEDVLEILAGIVPKKVNVKIDRSERSLITSLANQVHKQTALTDRQLDLALAKISKYRVGLEANSVDVDEVLLTKPLRMPLRVIDRSQKIYFDYSNNFREQRIHVKSSFFNKNDNFWGKIREQLSGQIVYEKSVMSVPATELNLHVLVSALNPLDYEIDQEVQEIFEKIEEILKNREKFIPQIVINEAGVLIENVPDQCLKAAQLEFPSIVDENLISCASGLKKYGIFEKSQEIVKKIESANVSELTKNSALSSTTRFRVIPTKYSLKNVVETVNTLNQWPLLVIIEENSNTFSQILELHGALSEFVPNEEMTVFFRLGNENNGSKDFSQFVKDNSLNGFIDQKTKVVFISKNRIPKPLFRANWNPQTALALINYDFGKTSAYLNDLSFVYYYNDAISVRHDKIKGSSQLVEL